MPKSTENSFIHPAGWDRIDCGEYHEIIPVDDIEEHLEGKVYCPCSPDTITIDTETGKPFPEGGYIFSHKAFDGRE